VGEVGTKIAAASLTFARQNPWEGGRDNGLKTVAGGRAERANADKM